MRDLKLLLALLDHLHKTGALSVPPEDLLVAVDEVVERFGDTE